MSEKLRWVRAFSPDIIPKYLIDQVRDRTYEVHDFYKYQGLNCLINTKEGQVLNPFNHLYVLADEDNMVKGFLWFVIDPLTKNVIINTFSVDKEYWNKGEAVKYLVEHMQEVLKKLELKKVYWISNYPKHSERYGFKRSRGVLMEYNEKEKNEEKEEENGPDNDGINKYRRQTDVDSGTTTTVQPVLEPVGAGSPAGT